jgi:tetratricopeptide (TPR) repeat protein
VKEPQGEMESEARKQSCKHHTGVQLYIYTFLLFAFGLMSKPMVVTIPFLMLLLDFWPLGRLQFSTVRGLFFEKVPFVLVSLMIGLLTVHSQKDFGAVGTVAQFPLMMRLGNAALSYVSYLAQTFWPIKMAAFYPYPTRLPLWSILGATLLLIAISIFVLQRMRRQPYLFVGWFWYLAALAPAIGLIQVGTQSRADRYSYVPLIGVFLAVTWFVSGILERWRHHSTVLPSLAFGILGTMIVITHGQIGYWKDGETLWAHALVVTKNNSTALCNYGRALERKGLQAQADEYYEQALRIEPGSLVANVNLGVARLEQGDALAASNHLARAVLMRSGLPVAHLNFARALVTLKNWAEAEKQFDLAAKADPKSYSVQTAWGECLVLQGEIEEASQHFEKALRLEANSPEDQAQLGMDRALKKTGAESSAYYRVVLRLQPDRIDALNNFAWLLATDSNPEVRNGRLAIQHAKKACELTQFRVPQFLGTLGAAYAENGQFDHASETAEKAVVSAEAAGDSNLVARNRELLGLYKAGKAYHEQSP